MNKSKIKIEYDECCKQKQVKKSIKNPNRGGRPFDYVMVDVKDPKCWEVITVENTVEFTPGHRLNKKQMESICRSANYDVEVGMPGQFRKASTSRY